MPIVLSDIEARVMGSLIEKSLTTPEQYPLTLNALVNACNQKSSREPVMQLDEAAVARSLSSLREKNLVFQKSESGNRVPKFGHRVENLLSGGTAKEVGAICVMLLRGPQTPGEIKTRTDRLCEFDSVADVVTVLDDLAQRPEGPLVARLARQSGQKETRFAQLFTDHPPTEEAPTPMAVAPGAAATREPSAPPARPASPMDSLTARVAHLEDRVRILEALVAKRQTNGPAQENA